MHHGVVFDIDEFFLRQGLEVVLRRPVGPIHQVTKLDRFRLGRIRYMQIHQRLPDAGVVLTAQLLPFFLQLSHFLVELFSLKLQFYRLGVPCIMSVFEVGHVVLHVFCRKSCPVQ